MTCVVLVCLKLDYYACSDEMMEGVKGCRNRLQQALLLCLIVATERVGSEGSGGWARGRVDNSEVLKELGVEIKSQGKNNCLLNLLQQMTIDVFLKVKCSCTRYGLVPVIQARFYSFQF